MRFKRSLSEAIPGPVQGKDGIPAVDNADLSDPMIAQLTQRKAQIQQQAQKQIAAIDQQIANRQKTNGKPGQKTPLGGQTVPGM